MHFGYLCFLLLGIADRNRSPRLLRVYVHHCVYEDDKYTGCMSEYTRAPQEDADERVLVRNRAHIFQKIM